MFAPVFVGDDSHRDSSGVERDQPQRSGTARQSVIGADFASQRDELVVRQTVLIKTGAPPNDDIPAPVALAIGDGCRAHSSAR